MSKEKKERNVEIVRLKKKGLGYRKIAAMFNIKPQRVLQIVQAYGDTTRK